MSVSKASRPAPPSVPALIRTRTHLALRRPAGTPGARGRAAKRLAQLAAPPKRLAPALVSAPAPGSFVHVAHVGFDAAGELDAAGAVEPGWAMMLGELHGYAARPKGKGGALEAEVKPKGGFAQLRRMLAGLTKAAGTVKRRGLGLRRPIFAFA